MRENLKYPKIEAVKSVFKKIGVDPATRYYEYDQDYEYTTCKLEELEQYIDLYKKEDTTVFEKRLLGCYLLECLNDYFKNNGISHPMQAHAFELLHSDNQIHESELEYWTNIADPDEDNWWPITKEIP